MTFNTIFDIFTYSIIGMIVMFFAYNLFVSFRQEASINSQKAEKSLTDEKINYLNAELALFDVKILSKDSETLEYGRLQSLSTFKLAGEFSLLSDDLSDEEVYRFIFKDKKYNNGFLEINLNEKLNALNKVENNNRALPNKFVKDEFDSIKSKQISAQDHKFLSTNKVAAVKGVCVASKNLVLKHTTINNKIESFKILKGDLLIPAINVDKEFITYQIVDKLQNKRMRIGKSLKGAFFPVGSYQAENEKYILCEDYLTAYTLHNSTGITALICFDPQNIFDVSQALLNKNPHVQLIFSTSRDMLTNNKSRIKKALYYSNLFDMPFIFPKFPDGSEYDHFKTWNELSRYESSESIKNKVLAQIKFFNQNGKHSTIQIACDKYGIEY